MGSHYDRGLLLFGQSRFELAEKEFRRELADGPDDPMPHAFLAYCLTERGEHDEAGREGREAIRLAPDHPFPHYVMARVFYNRDEYPAAEGAVQEAIRLDPEDPDYHGLSAAILADQGRWEEACLNAERGLELNPEHIGCTNLRAMALVRLGRRDEAGATISAALARNPESAFTHANQGWTLLHQGDHQRAFEHFRESLRLDPEIEWARQGIVEAMKARNPLYRPILNYFLWMSRLSDRTQWFVVIAIFMGPRILRGIGKANPGLQPWLAPLAAAIVLFVVVSWVADPLFNLLLRLDRFGRLALSGEQIVASNWVGSCLIGVALGFLAFAVTGNAAGLAGAIASGCLVVPMAATFQCPAGWRRAVMGAYTGLLAVLAAAGVALSALSHGGNQRELFAGFSGLTLAIVIGGAVVSTWLALVLSQKD